jgi:type II secretory pathway pseudopilin PulG
MVMGAVFAFVVTGGTVAAMNYRGSVAEGRSIAALQATLQVVHNEQANFRLLNQRFATWPELEAEGAKLAPTQKVLKSNASSSHWFMSVFDRETGAVCSQTGELFDEEPGERRPSCRPRDG